MTYLQAVVIALIQGVTELFPISSLGHSVLVPAWIGGNWQTLVTQSSQQNSESSFYLAYIVALHCATALALMWFFRADWIRIIRGFLRSLPVSVRLSLQHRRPRLAVRDKDERLAWMIIFATVPVGLTGVVLEHTFRVLFAKPSAAAVLLFINGLILLGAEALRRSAIRRKQAGAAATAGRPAQAFAPASAQRATLGAPQWETAASGYPRTPGYGRPAGSGYDRRADPGYGRGADPRYSRPADPGYGRPADPGYDRSADRRYDRRADPGYGRPADRDHGVRPDGVRAERPTSHRKSSSSGRAVADVDAAERSDARLARLSYGSGILIGATQILALLAGISRSGVTMAGGLWRGLDHEDAARFAFLLATPIILAAGVLKVPSLLGPAGAHIHGQVVLGVIVCGIAAYLSVRFLVRWFETRTLTPFAIYCLVFGALSAFRFL